MCATAASELGRAYASASGPVTLSDEPQGCLYSTAHGPVFYNTGGAGVMSGTGAYAVICSNFQPPSPPPPSASPSPPPPSPPPPKPSPPPPQPSPPPPSPPPPQPSPPPPSPPPPQPSPPPPSPPPPTTYQLLESGRACATEVKNLGNIASPELCYDATVADAACGPAFMFAPVYHASWGCRCCTNKETTGQSNPNWDLYEIVEEQTVTISSDGTQAKPYCSWSTSCPSWSISTQNECALKLCEASGYTSATFVSANPSGGMCIQSIVTGVQHYWNAYSNVYEQKDYNKEVAVTAECSGSRRRLDELPQYETKTTKNSNASDDDANLVREESIWTRWLNVPDMDESRGQAVVKPAAGPLLRKDAHHRF